jgi:AraC-like DNA-binding protein
MKRFQIVPHPTLAPFIDRIWGWESEDGEAISLPFLMPGTGADVFFHYRTPFLVERARKGREKLGVSHLICVRQHPTQLHATHDVWFVAVRFRVGCLRRFIATPASELFDQYPTAADLWSCQGRELVTQFRAAPTRTARLQLIQSFFLASLTASNTDPVAEAAALRIYRDCASASIEKTGLVLGIGRRQIERRVKALTGHTPIEIRSLSRLQKTIRALALKPQLSVVDTALAHGYYDQSHFIHAFRRLGCGSPQRFRAVGRLKTHFYNTPWRSTDRLEAAPWPGAVHDRTSSRVDREIRQGRSG